MMIRVFEQDSYVWAEYFYLSDWFNLIDKILEKLDLKLKE